VKSIDNTDEHKMPDIMNLGDNGIIEEALLFPDYNCSTDEECVNSSLNEWWRCNDNVPFDPSAEYNTQEECNNTCNGTCSSHIHDDIFYCNEENYCINIGERMWGIHPETNEFCLSDFGTDDNSETIYNFECMDGIEIVDGFLNVNFVFDSNEQEGNNICQDSDSACCEQFIYSPAYIPGCTNSEACNYDETATDDDGSCLENDCADVCGGSAVSDECGICNGGNADDLGCGCYNPAALSYCEDTDGDGLGAPTSDTMFCLDVLPAGWVVDGCTDPEPDCTTNDTDECGVCSGDGIPDGDCDCAGNVEDCAGVCGGFTLNLGCGCGELFSCFGNDSELIGVWGQVSAIYYDNMECTEESMDIPAESSILSPNFIFNQKGTGGFSYIANSNNNCENDDECTNPHEGYFCNDNQPEEQFYSYASEEVCMENGECSGCSFNNAFGSSSIVYPKLVISPNGE